MPDTEPPTAMIAEQTEQRLYTVAEYLDLELGSAEKHEFVDGTLIDMPGESKKANLIAGNIYVALRLGLKKKPFTVYNHDVKLRTVPGRKYRYPDLMVVPADDTDDTHVAHRAILTVEVTSENSSGTDHDDKLHEYTGLPSVQYYLIVSQAEPLVEVYARAGSQWAYDFYTDLADVVSISTLGLMLPLAEIYEGVF